MGWGGGEDARARVTGDVTQAQSDELLSFSLEQL